MQSICFVLGEKKHSHPENEVKHNLLLFSVFFSGYKYLMQIRTREEVEKIQFVEHLEIYWNVNWMNRHSHGLRLVGISIGRLLCIGLSRFIQISEIQFIYALPYAGHLKVMLWVSYGLLRRRCWWKMEMSIHLNFKYVCKLNSIFKCKWIIVALYFIQLE